MKPENMDFDQMLKAAEAMKAFQAANPQSNESKTLFDSLTKIAVAICTAGILWLVASVAEVQNEMTKLNVQQHQTEKTLDGLQVFSQKPRFTIEDYHSAIAPIQQTVTRHNVELADRKEWGSRLTRLENRYEIINEQLADITQELKTLNRLKRGEQ